ncbi:MAG: 30S ribosomal protein S17 [Bdellovibrionota bacterium]
MTQENISDKNVSAQKRGKRKLRIGTVISDKMDKTITVSITEHTKVEPYGKYVKRTVKYLAHDKDNACNIGDTVKIVETRPLSRRKRWAVQEILTRAE